MSCAVTESLAKGLPMVIWDPIPGQEVYNSVFLLENGAAVAPTSKATLGFKVDVILGNPERLRSMKAAAGRLVNARAAEDIAEMVLSNVGEPCVKVSKLNAGQQGPNGRTGGSRGRLAASFAVSDGKAGVVAEPDAKNAENCCPRRIWFVYCFVIFLK